MGLGLGLGLGDQDYECLLLRGGWGIGPTRVPPTPAWGTGSQGHTRCYLRGVSGYTCCRQRRGQEVALFPSPPAWRTSWDGAMRGGDRRSRATLFCGMDRVGWDHVPPLPPHLHGNQGARLLVSLPAWGTGHRVRWGYTSPSAWGTKGLGPLVPLPAWGTHLHGALGGWGHPCPCLHRGLGGVWVMRVLTCRVRWSHAYPCVRGSRATGQSGLGLCTSLPAWAQDTVGTGRHPLCPTRGGSPCCALWCPLEHLAPGVSPGGKAGNITSPCVHGVHSVCTGLGFSG